MKSFRALATISMIHLSLSGCGVIGNLDSPGNNGTPTPDIVLQQQPTALSILVLDAATGQPIPSSAKVVFGSALAGKMIDGKESAVTEVTADRGAASVFTTGGATGELSLLVKADGYLAGGTSIQVGPGLNAAEIRLINIAAPPASVPLVSASVQMNSDSVAQNVVISTPATGTAPAVTLTLPQGTVMKDGSGNPVSGTVTAVVTYHSPVDSSALTTFPGGFDVTAQVANGNKEPVSFVSAGFTSIEISNTSGQSVRTFSKPVEVRVDIAPGTTNPETDQPIQAGDVIPTWSFDVTTGAWKEEGSATVKADGAKLYSVMNVTHLSYWNLDFHYKGTCQLNSPYIEIPSQLQGKRIAFRLSRVGGGYTVEGLYDAGSRLSLLNFPGIYRMNYSATYHGKVIGTLDNYMAACGAKIPMTFAVPAEVSPTATISVNSVCNSNHGIKTPVPSNLVLIANENAEIFFLGSTNAQGTITTTLPGNAAYYVFYVNRFDGGYSYSMLNVGTSSVTKSIEIPVNCTSR